MKARIAGSERLAGDILTGVLRHVTAEKTSERHNREEEERAKSDEESDDTNDKSDLLSNKTKSNNDNRWDQVANEEAKNNEHALRQMLRTSPFARNVGPFGEGCAQLDKGRDDSTNRYDGPHQRTWWGLVTLLRVVLRVEWLRVEGSVKPEDSNVDDPDTVEVDERVEPCSRFFVSLEEDLLPVHLAKLLVSFSRRNIDQARLVLENDTLDTFRVPEELIDVVVADDVFVVLLAANVFAVIYLVTLITEEVVQWRNNVVQKGALFDRLHAVLASRRMVKVVGALVDEAESLGTEPNLISLTPAEQVESNLANSVVLRHAVHARFPAILGGFQAVVALESAQSFLLIVRVLTSLSFGSFASFTSPAVSFAEFHVGKTNRIVEIEMSCEVPPSVVGILSTNVVRVQRQKSLVRGHTRSTRIQQCHQMVELVSHTVSLETELGSEIEEDFLDLLFRQGNLSVGGPCGIRLARALTSW